MEYVTDESGRRTRVILDIKEYERHVEAAEDAEDARDHERVMAAIGSGEEERIPFGRRSSKPVGPLDVARLPMRI